MLYIYNIYINIDTEELLGFNVVLIQYVDLLQIVLYNAALSLSQ